MAVKTNFGLDEDVVLRRGGNVNIPLRMSPSGAANVTWGYIGSGPLDLAFNILLAAGLDPDEAADFHRGFLQDFLVWIPNDQDGRIAKDAIRYWIWLQRVCTHPEWEPRLMNGGSRCVACNRTQEELAARSRGDDRRSHYPGWSNE